MWVEELVPISEFFEYSMQSAYQNGHLYVGCLIARQAEYEVGFEYIKKNWESFHDLTGEELILVFAGEGYGKSGHGDNLLGSRMPSLYNDDVKRITNGSVVYCGNTSYRGYVRIIPQYSASSENYSPENHTLQIRSLVSYFGLSEQDLPAICIRSTITNSTFIFKLKNGDGTNLYGLLKEFRTQLLKRLPTISETASQSDCALADLKKINVELNELKSILGRQELNERLLTWRKERFECEDHDVDSFTKDFLALSPGESPKLTKEEILEKLRSVCKSSKKYQSGKKIVVKYLELSETEDSLTESRKVELHDASKAKLIELEKLSSNLIKEEGLLISSLSRNQTIKEVIGLADSISAKVKLGPMKLDVKTLLERLVNISYKRRL